MGASAPGLPAHLLASGCSHTHTHIHVCPPPEYPFSINPPYICSTPMEKNAKPIRHPSAADNGHLLTLVDFEDRRQRSRAHRNELVVEIPVALLDLFERETVIPLTRPRTHSNAAALRIGPRDPEPNLGLFSIIIAGGSFDPPNIKGNGLMQNSI